MQLWCRDAVRWQREETVIKMTACTQTACQGMSPFMWWSTTCTPQKSFVQRDIGSLGAALTGFTTSSWSCERKQVISGLFFHADNGQLWPITCWKLKLPLHTTLLPNRSIHVVFWGGFHQVVRRKRKEKRKLKLQRRGSWYGESLCMMSAFCCCCCCWWW